MAHSNQLILKKRYQFSNLRLGDPELDDLEKYLPDEELPEDIPDEENIPEDTPHRKKIPEEAPIKESPGEKVPLERNSSEDELLTLINWGMPWR